jgi:hypothetical protein
MTIKVQWRAFWIDPDGWLRSREFDTSREAQSFLKGCLRPLQAEELRFHWKQPKTCGSGRADWEDDKTDVVGGL